jgi:hypothetical protein
MLSQRNLKVGNRYGRWTMLSQPQRVGAYLVSQFECECGTKKVVLLKNIVNGSSTSCGCYNRSIRRPGRVTHNKSYTRSYRVYHGMIDRCYNRKNPAYDRYGGRGITVCERWLTAFEHFFEDMGERPTDLSLERVENDAGYSPDNCRWATLSEQARNKRNNNLIRWQGKTQTLAQWAEETGIPRDTICARLKKGMTTHAALTTPLRLDKRHRNRMLHGQKYSIRGRDSPRS